MLTHRECAVQRRHSFVMSWPRVGATNITPAARRARFAAKGIVSRAAGQSHTSTVSRVRAVHHDVMSRRLVVLLLVFSYSTLRAICPRAAAGQAGLGSAGHGSGLEGFTIVCICVWAEFS